MSRFIRLFWIRRRIIHFIRLRSLDSYLDLETRFEELVRKVLSVKRQQCINKPENIDKLVKETLADFKVAYTQ